MKVRILIFALIIMMAGCSFEISKETITDENTTSYVSIIENVTSKMLTHNHNYDDMDRGNHDYYGKTLVIDPNVNVSKLSRGDVVIFDNEDGEKDISRVVALPGEKVKITKGKTYINGKKLETFYGNAHRAGWDKESYFEKMDNEGNKYDKKGMKEVFEKSIKEIQLSDSELYLIDDDWLRGKIRVLNEEKLLGKVVGYN